MKELKLAVASDLHLGHRRNETVRIIQNLDAAFPDNAQTADLDIIVLAGDIYDHLLNLPDDCVYDIDNWIVRLLKLCKKHDIQLYVLYGTKSHDMDQGRRFIHLNNAAKIGCDVRYIDTLCVEYIDKHDIHVLFVPDDLNPDASKTLADVRSLMKAKGLTKVDYAFMHGAFDYQLPDIVHSKHDSDAYLDLVDKLIFIGHIHTHSQKDRIIAQGSFDRLSHGEEEPKGHVRATVRSRDDYELRFIENEAALKFLTLDCRGLTLAETLEEIALFVRELPDGVHVRVNCSKDNPILTEMDQLVRMRPLIHWSKQVKKSLTLEEDSEDPFQPESIFVPIKINKENIVDLMMQRVQLRIADPAMIDAARAFLVEMR